MAINSVSPGGYELYLYFLSIPYGAKHKKHSLLTADHFAPLNWSSASPCVSVSLGTLLPMIM